MKSLIDILSREQRLVEDINALVREAEWQTDKVELGRLYTEKETKEKDLEFVRDEIREYSKTYLRKSPDSGALFIFSF